jgi:predicted dehydrogenase
LSNNLTRNAIAYQFLTNFRSENFSDKSIAIIGAGGMAEQYANTLSKMKIQDVTIISKDKKKVNRLCTRFNFKPLSGGYKKNMSSLEKKNLIIIATPIHLLIPATEMAVLNGQQNILIEKPASLYAPKLISLSKKIKSKKIRVAYNRLLYPNLYLLKQLIEKDGGITSCIFTFTEWIHTINFKKEKSNVYKLWGIANTLHVISMVTELIGFPKKLSSFKYGRLDWHPSGSIFVGSGISRQGIPFSYHGDWTSSGRWGIEIMTAKNAYRLIPLEDLFVCKKGSVKWKQINFKRPYPNTKPGLAEQIALMLSKEKPVNLDLPSLRKAAEFNRLAEKIFGYKK